MLTVAQSSRLSAYIQKERGITPLVLSAIALNRGVRRRLEALNLPDAVAYESYLLEGGRDDELDWLLQGLLPPETYFFRDSHQLKSLVCDVLPRAKDAHSNVGTLRMESCGCSSGEEAYTLAMLAEESGLFRGWQVDVVGVDWNQRLLEIGRQGTYGERSLRNASVQRRLSFFEAHEAKQFRVKQQFRSQVSFVRSNLVNCAEALTRPQADIVLCRNVLIYFDASVRTRIVQYLHARLRAGGWLLLGHSENLLNVPSQFELEQLSDALVYRAAK